MQETDEIKFLVSYTSDMLLTRETRYSVIDKEYLAHFSEIKKLILFLNGEKFQLETDGRVMRWVLNIQSYPFTGPLKKLFHYAIFQKFFFTFLLYIYGLCFTTRIIK